MNIFKRKAKDQYVSLRKRMNNLSEYEVKVIQKSARKILNKMDRKFKKNWYKNCRVMFIHNSKENVYTLILYHIDSGSLISSISFVHESDKKKAKKDISKKICMSRLANSLDFLIKTTE